MFYKGNKTHLLNASFKENGEERTGKLSQLSPMPRFRLIKASLLSNIVLGLICLVILTQKRKDCSIELGYATEFEDAKFAIALEQQRFDSPLQTDKSKMEFEIAVNWVRKTF